MNWQFIFETALLIWIIFDPLGCIPIFVSQLKDVNPKRRNYILARELILTLILMILILFGGEAFFALFNIECNVLQIAGGILVFILALNMLFARHRKEKRIKVREPFIFPLAIPALVGPGTIATLTFLSGAYEETLPLILAIFIAWLASVPCLVFAPVLIRLLKSNGLVALDRLFGYLIVLLAVQMGLKGITQTFHLYAP